MSTLAEHWNGIFANKSDNELGWYEGDTSQTFKLLETIPADSGKTVFLPGAGTSILVEDLLQRGYRLIVNDISNEALHTLRQRLGDDENAVKWLLGDISKDLSAEVLKVDIWVDRAVLHFLVKEEDILGYFDNLRSFVASGGYVLLAEFATDGANRCAGLDLHRYSLEEMSKRLGASFEYVQHEEYCYTSPFGETRPYLYALFKKKAPSQNT